MITGIVAGGVRVATPAGPTVTWNPADISAGISLSGGDLIATASGGTFGNRMGRATSGHDASTSGGRYFEVEVTSVLSSVFNVFVGVATTSANLSGYLGSDPYGWSYGINATKNTGSGSNSYGTTYGTGDVIGILLKNGKLYFRKNGTWQNSADVIAETGAAFSGLTGTLIPALSMFRGVAPAHVLTGRFKASDFTGSIPSGAAAWES